jgi:hypothetical protein
MSMHTRSFTKATKEKPTGQRAIRPLGIPANRATHNSGYASTRILAETACEVHVPGCGPTHRYSSPTYAHGLLGMRCAWNLQAR